MAWQLIVVAVWLAFDLLTTVGAVGKSIKVTPDMAVGMLIILGVLLGLLISYGVTH